LENRAQQAVEGMALSQDATIEAIAALVECRDQITGQHAQRTREYIRHLIEELRRQNVYVDELTPDYGRLIVKTAPLHDIGKVGIRDSILLKKGDLSPIQRRRMKAHTTKGAEALRLAGVRAAGIPYLECARKMALYHHEQWNGSGYPEGLSGEDIPLCARLMAVADVYDALRQDRPYRPAWPHGRCVAHIRGLSETAFDPAIVEAFSNVADQFALISRQYTAVP
jgi:putative two-component system response regulator